MDRAAPTPARTVCHGCRQVTHVKIDDVHGDIQLRPMSVPGEGTVWVDRAPGMLIQISCLECGDSEDPGWAEGLVTPA